MTFNLQNTGNIAGNEVVQLYIKDLQSSVDRPVKELKGFKKIGLKPGESKSVQFTIDKNALSFFDPKTKEWTVERGEFEILVGSSSQDIKLKDTFTLK
jgi:beta-glucosidase